MSRVYFHSPSGEAELRGSERAHLRFIADGPAGAAWDLNRHADLDWMAEIIGLIPEVPDGDYGANYLHTYLREARTEDARNAELYKAWKPGTLHPATTYEAVHQLRRSLETRLTGGGSETVFVVAGHELHAVNVALNTALAVGSDAVKLAAKIHGWCESHAWVDGPDRAWMADLIDEGLTVGIYRRGMWYSDRADGPRDKWSSQGWEDVQAHLRSRDDEPCVMSYSVCEQFPDAGISTFMPPWPDGVPKQWDALTPEQQQEREAAQEAWYELSADEQWSSAMDGLKLRRPWAQLTPDTLNTTFGPAVTVYDLLAPDRDERVSAAFDLDRAA